MFFVVFGQYYLYLSVIYLYPIVIRWVLKMFLDNKFGALGRTMSEDSNWERNNNYIYSYSGNMFISK